jgi:hypothetical protein
MTDNPIRKAMQNLPGHWHKGNYADGQGNFCGLGHVGNVLGYSSLNDITTSHVSEVQKTFDLLHNVAAEQYGVWSFPEFNDREDTTEEQVLALMEKAAIKWDETAGLTD